MAGTGGKRAGAGRPRSSSSIATETARAIMTRMVEEKIIPITEALIERALDRDTAAARELLDRSWGRAQQNVDITSKGEKVGTTPAAVALTDEYEKKLKNDL